MMYFHQINNIIICWHIDFCKPFFWIATNYLLFIECFVIKNSLGL